MEKLPETRKINRYDTPEMLKKIAPLLASKKRILVVGGSDFDISGQLRQVLADFTQRYECVAVCDNFANVYSNHPRILNPKTLGDVIAFWEVSDLSPDLILSFGNVYYSTIKYFLPQYAKNTEHWQIAADGMINDGFHCLTKIFAFRPEVFFGAMNRFSTHTSSGSYAKLWQDRLGAICEPELNFTNFYAIKTLGERLPENAVLHTSVLDSIRLSNYANLPVSVKCFANIGADGIDGALSTFLGQANAEENLSFLIVGDLSLLYDMNGLLQEIPDNVRIMVVNNYAGAEFHKNFGLERIATLDNYVAAGHKVKLQHCCINQHFHYLSAENKEQLEAALPEFLSHSDKPILLEVFTNAPMDATTLKAYWKINRNIAPQGKASLRGMTMRVANKLLSQRAKDKLRNILNALRS